MTDPVGVEVSFFSRVGGRQGIGNIVDAFYRRIEADPEMRSLYPEDLAPGREKLKLFLEQWFGGEPLYSNLYGHPRLRRRHFPFVIAELHAGRWLRYMREAMQEQGLGESELRPIFERLAPLAHHMVNANDDVPREPLGDIHMT